MPLLGPLDEHQSHTAPTYADRIRTWRERKDDAFRTRPDSPLPEPRRASFPGLAYYPVDADLVFAGLELEPYPDPATVVFAMLTTDGRQRSAERVGRFRFTLEGGERLLTAYRFADRPKAPGEELFVPFQDATTGPETYAAGRYLDLGPAADGTWTLDFNMAYHPLCAYDMRFSCPMTPPENRLPVRVEAGERLGDAGH
jgi:hypothetical protein